jgi:UDP-N-acetylmuramoyl-L-alanyl-D-glutamate--2,6-diaminopimelate ligase
MRLHELINGFYTKPLPDAFRDFEVLTVSCDSREEQKDGLFVALPGPQFNGENFIKDAVAKGARIIVRKKPNGHSDPERSEGEEPKGALRSFASLRMTTGAICELDVEDPKQFLQTIGQRFYGAPSQKIKSIGITGTNGKTTISFFVESIIHAAAKRCGVVGTINHRIGANILPSKNTTPGFLDNQRFLSQLVGLNFEYCVMEVSSHGLDQGRLAAIDFSAGIFTNLTQDHLDYHKDMESYFKAKSLLFKSLPSSAVAIINADDEYGKRMMSLTKAKIITYAIDHPADIRAQNLTYQLGGSSFEIVFPKGKIKIQTPFIGKHNVYNTLAAFAWGMSEGLASEAVRRGIESLTHVPGRLEPVENDKGLFLFIDYAHTQDGLDNVLKALRAVTSTEIILVFGCGGDRDRGKRPKMARAACNFADFSFVTSDNPRSEDPRAIIDQIITGFTKKNYEVCVDRKEAIGRALKMAREGQVVLIAGKGHEDYQIFKDRTIAFNEREIVKECLQSLRS